MRLLALGLAGQVLFGLAADRWGLFGMPRRKAGLRDFAALGSATVAITLGVGGAILLESGLSFLGLGVQEPFASLGSLINEGAQEMESSPWMLLVPATLLTVLLVAFNLLGNGLRATLESRDE